MTVSNKAALTMPVDPADDEMNDKVDRAIDDQAARSTPMTPRK